MTREEKRIIADNRIDEMKKLVDRGKTQTEIARIFGISRQRVSVLMANYTPSRYQPIATCKYVGLREWLHKNKVGCMELTRRLGYVPNASQSMTIRKLLTGEYTLRKPMIDKVLALTGGTYEDIFKEDKE